MHDGDEAGYPLEPLGDLRERMCTDHPCTPWGLRLGLPLPPAFPEVRPSQALSPCSVLLQVITLEGWVEIMYYVMDAHSFYNFIYFILLIIVSDASGPCGDGGSWENGWRESRDGEACPV